MKKTIPSDREALWEAHDEEFREPSEIVAYWQDATRIDRRLLEYKVNGRWWRILEESGITLLVTREYEHLLLALCVDEASRPSVTMMRMPHPSGLTVDRSRGVVHVASTRNPNQIFDLVPSRGVMQRLDVRGEPFLDSVLLPMRTRFLPGCLYVHELAMIGDELYANSVGQNAIVRLSPSGNHTRVWWPKCIETREGPVFGRNHLQLNSIAAGDTLEESFFSASTDEVSDVRPGDPVFPVDRRGVIFSASSREPVVRGLTRPHSARNYAQRIWVDNSGYGEVGYVDAGRFQPVNRLPGWTRGLSFFGRIMFVGTSRVLPRFSAYAPGLDAREAQCGIHALDVMSGEILGSIVWPYGSQIFSVEWVPSTFSSGLPFRLDDDTSGESIRDLFYSFNVSEVQE
ncbi:MAG: DUF4915 domain-containing protein [Desulfomonilaceae bacterium]|nr:DUF4915 domain-containing protein [Desulfomonilaceae bacterium]